MDSQRTSQTGSLNSVIQSLSVNNSGNDIVNNISVICRVIEELYLVNKEKAKHARDISKLIREFCVVGLVPLLNSLNELNGLKDTIIITAAFSKKLDIFISGFKETVNAMIDSLKDFVADDTQQLIIMYGEDALKQVSSVLSCIKNIVGAINDMFDVKKNSFINPSRILFVKMIVKRTIKSIINIIRFMCDELLLIGGIIDEKKIKEINKTTEPIYKIISCIAGVLKEFISLPLLILKFTLASIVIIPGLVLFQVLLFAIISVLATLKLIGKISDNIKKSVVGVQGLVESLEIIIKKFIKIGLLMILLVPISVLAVIATPIIVLSVMIIALGVFAISKILDMIDGKTIKRSLRATKKILLLIANIALICAALLLFVITLAPVVGILLLGMAMLVLIFLALALVVKAMSLMAKLMKAKDILAVTLILLFVAFAIVAFIGITMLLIILQEQVSQIDIMTVVLFMVGFIVFVVILAVIGHICVALQAILIPAAYAIGIVIGVVMVVVGALYLIAYLLNELTKISLNTDAIKKVVNTIFDTIEQIVNAIFQDGKEDKESGKGDSWWKTALNYFGSGLGALFKSLVTMAYLAQAVASVYLIKWIANCLNEIQEIRLNKDIILGNVDVILSTANTVINNILQDGKEDKESGKEGSWWDSALEWLGDNSMIRLFKAMSSLIYLTQTLASVYLIKWIANCLNEIQEIQLNKDAISNNVDVILSTANTVINNILQDGKEDKESGKEGSWWDSALEWLGDNSMVRLFKAMSSLIYLSQILASVYLIKWIANCLSELQKINLDSGKITTGVNNILSVADAIVNKLTKSDGVGLLDFKSAQINLSRYNTLIDSIVDIQNKLMPLSNANQITKGCIDLITIVSKFNDTFNKVDEKKATSVVKEYTKFLKQIDSMNLKNLETSVKLFEEMARFSESINGNFDKLADTLNEKIAPLLEELKTSLNTVQERVEKNAENPTTDSAMEKQEIRNNLQQAGQTKNLSDKEINDKVDSKYKSDVQERYGIDEIISKLGSIINLFQSGDAVVRTS